MNCVKKISDDLYWIGANDRRISLFENLYPVPAGMSYNSYFVDDEQTMLLDTADKAVSRQFLENLDSVLHGRSPDYLTITHMEPDHCAVMGELFAKYPEMKIVCNTKSAAMIRQFFDFDPCERTILVKEGDTLCTGRHTFTFLMAPMVHWPEVMAVYDSADRTLFSADAFGAFGALSGNLFADETDFLTRRIEDLRRYYTNIVGKYGMQVQALLKKTSSLDISLLCPLHGPVWRRDLPALFEKYRRWSAYEPEETAVMIAYGSIYGGTENAAEILASELAVRGVTGIALYDVSATDCSVLVSEAFRCSHLVLASPTYNAGLFPKMEQFLTELAAHNLQNRTVALIENGSWAPAAGKRMAELLEPLKGMTVLCPAVSLRSTLKDAQPLATLADTLAASLLPAPPAGETDPSAMYKISYGLFVLTARDGEKDNGCIINTAMQITDSPKRITIAVNKLNYTHDMILKTGNFNVSILSEDTPFATFERFGFQSGRSAEKFDPAAAPARTENGIAFVPETANAVLSGRVISTIDCGSHTLFVAEVTEARTLSDRPSATYQYYFDHIKPKPAAAKKKGFVCKICGYVYEGDELPADFICPICKHGAEDFEPLQ